MAGLKGSFFIAVLTGATAVMGWAAYAHYAHPTPAGIAARRLTGDVWVTEQVTPQQIGSVHAGHFATVVDMRPDGEQEGQPSSAQIADAAAREGLAFSYDPVPHGAIPDESVDALLKVMATQPKPILLYCRSGRRAARTWALAEASRPGGLDSRSIEQFVEAAGQPVGDLVLDIQARIAARPTSR